MTNADGTHGMKRGVKKRDIEFCDLSIVEKGGIPVKRVNDPLSKKYKCRGGGESIVYFDKFKIFIRDIDGVDEPRIIIKKV